jgi:hypothetical protein
MQIYEIARQSVDEGILKGVANNVVKPVVNYAVDQAKGVAKAPLNTAEYFANKVLNAAGVPQDQQGNYSKYGHMAAGQRKGTASIAQHEFEVANALSKEWSSTRTLNGTKADTLDPEVIKQAAIAYNAGTSNLEINADNVVKTVQTLAPQYVKDREEQQMARVKGQIAAKKLMAELEQQYAISKDTTQSLTQRQQAIAAKNKVIDELTKLGYKIDQKYLDNTVAAAQSAIVQTGGSPLLTATPPAAKAPVTPATSPAGFNYNNIMKMPGMNAPVKKPATTPPAVKTPELEPVAESLTWSKNFDPSRQLYRRMKQGQLK